MTTTYDLSACCCGSVCCEMALQATITGDCFLFENGTDWGFYSDPDPPGDPVYDGNGPVWELDPAAHSEWVTFNIRCLENGTYELKATIRTNFPDGSPAVNQIVTQIESLDDCEDDFEWTFPITFDALNWACPGGTTTIVITRKP